MVKKVSIMHACGHDTHRNVDGNSRSFSIYKKRPKGTVKFIFQPAEEGAPDGEEEELMVKEGVPEQP
jgi:amidohydrolase